MIRIPSVLVAIVIVGTVMLGCGRKAAQQPPKPAAQKSTVPLPEWAPKNPSPEFLRAARVLRPEPMDALTKGDIPKETLRALLEYKKPLDQMLWQLFGSLSDAQIQSFLAARRVALSVHALTVRQRAALDAVLDANKGREVEVSGVRLPDFRTLLYKMGANQDLSNVTIGFTIEGANTMSFNARVQGVKDPLVWTGSAQAPRLGPKAMNK